MDKKKRDIIILAVLAVVFLMLFTTTYLRKAGLARQSKNLTSDASLLAGIEGDMPLDEALLDTQSAKARPEIKYESTTIDPFKDRMQEYLFKIRTQGLETKNAVMPRVNIEGLIWNSSMPQAIVNGKVLKIGDTIEGIKLLKVEKNGITVKCGEEIIFVPKKT